MSDTTIKLKQIIYLGDRTITTEAEFSFASGNLISTCCKEAIAVFKQMQDSGAKQ